MSVYSGFATRKQENEYNRLIQGLVTIMQKRIIKFYTNQPCDEIAFQKILSKVVRLMSNLEESKYSDPKLTQFITGLLDVLGINLEQYSVAQNLPTDLDDFKKGTNQAFVSKYHFSLSPNPEERSGGQAHAPFKVKNSIPRSKRNYNTQQHNKVFETSQTRETGEDENQPLEEGEYLKFQQISSNTLVDQKRKQSESFKIQEVVFNSTDENSFYSPDRTNMSFYSGAQDQISKLKSSQMRGHQETSPLKGIPTQSPQYDPVKDIQLVQIKVKVPQNNNQLITTQAQGWSSNLPNPSKQTFFQTINSGFYDSTLKSAQNSVSQERDRSQQRGSVPINTDQHLFMNVNPNSSKRDEFYENSQFSVNPSQNQYQFSLMEASQTCQNSPKLDNQHQRSGGGKFIHTQSGQEDHRTLELSKVRQQNKSNQDYQQKRSENSQSPNRYQNDQESIRESQMRGMQLKMGSVEQQPLPPQITQSKFNNNNSNNYSQNLSQAGPIVNTQPSDMNTVNNNQIDDYQPDLTHNMRSQVPPTKQATNSGRSENTKYSEIGGKDDKQIDTINTIERDEQLLDIGETQGFLKENQPIPETMQKENSQQSEGRSKSTKRYPRQKLFLDLEKLQTSIQNNETYTPNLQNLAVQQANNGYSEIQKTSSQIRHNSTQHQRINTNSQKNYQSQLPLELRSENLLINQNNNNNHFVNHQDSEIIPQSKMSYNFPPEKKSSSQAENQSNNDQFSNQEFSEQELRKVNANINF